MSSPSLKDLPCVDVTLKSQLEGFNQEKLKDVDTQVKVVLPTAEGNNLVELLNVLKDFYLVVELLSLPFNFL